MTPRSFFTIFIKILGIYLILDSLTVVPGFIANLGYTFGFSAGDNVQETAITVFLLLLILAIYFFILRFCVLRTGWVIDKLKLDKGFAEEKFELNIESSTVLRIAVMVIGGLIFAEGLPSFCKEAYSYIGVQQTTARFGEKPEANWLIFYFVKTLIGYFLMVNSRMLVSFIERRQKE